MLQPRSNDHNNEVSRYKCSQYSELSLAVFVHFFIASLTACALVGCLGTGDIRTQTPSIIAVELKQ